MTDDPGKQAGWPRRDALKAIATLAAVPLAAPTGTAKERRGGTAVLPTRVGPFDTELGAGGRDNGWFVGGTGWYRTRFSAAACVSRGPKLRKPRTT